jgi:hypothetical protein
MGTFANCRVCGERIEFVLNKNHKKIPLNIMPSILLNKYTRRLEQARVSHFTTCCKNKKGGS